MTRHFAISLPVGSSLENHTGAWRTERPQYADFLPPCNNACPAGENVQNWLYHAEEADYQEAWEEIMRNNPFPAIMGRACYHPCETACNRATVDEAVSIHSVERFLGDRAIAEGWHIKIATEKSGKRILIVGGGPSGLSAAYHLARLGHSVTIVEAEAKAGGMMRYGIPEYRLPRDVIDAEVQRILDMGVTLRLNEKVRDIPAAMKKESFDACFLAIGAHISKHVDIPSPDAGRVLDALHMLRDSENSSDKGALIGRRVIVYGGGNTALDVARSAKRLGGESIIVYRRTKEKMPAHAFEVEEAIEEGIQFRWLETIKHLSDETITIEKMKLDSDGYPQPTGEFEVISGDMVVLALGQDVDTSITTGIPGIKNDKDGIVSVDSNMMTGFPGLFAGGDMVPSERTITVAVGHGKKAARNIDAYLRGKEFSVKEKHTLATAEKLNTWYYSDAEKAVQPTLEMLRRRTTFEEVFGGLDETNALFEARRCMSCGNCFECDNCLAVCPDNAIRKLPMHLGMEPGKGRFEINYDYCKGCGICVAECPAGAMEMVPEVI